MTRLPTRYLVVASLPWVLAGCTPTSAAFEDVRAPRAGDVGLTEITSSVPAAGRMVMADGETFFMPMASQDNALPSYPQALLAQRLPPQTVCLRVSIDSAGAVMDATRLARPPDCPGSNEADARFLAAAAAAARTWHFDPAVRCEYPNLQARQREDCTGGRETPQAVSLVYRFVFEQRDGRGLVRMAD